MPKNPLIIAPAAKADLEGIYEYGVRNWGETQAGSYMEAIKEIFWSLTEQQLLGVERPELFPGIRSLPVESHILFYRVETSTVEILRVLHGRQDPARHLR